MTPFVNENVSIDFPIDGEGFCPDFPLDVCIVPYGEVALGNHFSLDMAVNDEIAGEFE